MLISILSEYSTDMEKHDEYIYMHSSIWLMGAEVYSKIEDIWCIIIILHLNIAHSLSCA